MVWVRIHLHLVSACSPSLGRINKYAQTVVSQILNEALSYCSLVSNKDLKFPHNTLIQYVGYLLQNSEDALKLTFHKKDTVSKIKNKNLIAHHLIWDMICLREINLLSLIDHKLIKASLADN